MQKAFSFIEILISLAIASIALAAVIALAMQNIAAAQVTRDNLIAANLAQEGIEIIANFRSNNWLAFPAAFNANGSLTNWRGSGCANGNTDYCLLISVSPSQFIANYNSKRILPAATSNTTLGRDASGKYCHQALDAGCTITTPFARTIMLENIPGNDHQFKVVSTVFWTLNNQSHSVSVEDRLYNWR